MFSSQVNFSIFRFFVLALIPFCTPSSIFGGITHIPTVKPANNYDPPSTALMPLRNRDITIGFCTWAIDRECPDTDIKFYLYTRKNVMDRQYIHVADNLENSNLTSSYFDPKHPTKIIIHGYNSDMFMHPIYTMREEYLVKEDYNVIYVDWSVLSPSPCYMSAVHNTKHAGLCVSLLVKRILDMGSTDIHVIGFSLGAQLANYIARNLNSTFLLPRITGLDPAMPLFVTAGADDKLDQSDAVFVDVIHTNALVQGKLERCGHADFYMNGGIMQPGCYGAGSNPFACSHQRATSYFLESIRSNKGFWGWHCSSYIYYLLGMCPPTNNLVEAGENVKRTSRGMFLIETNDTTPFALGKWTDPPTLGAKRPTLILSPPPQLSDPLLRKVDLWGKLESRFNNIPNLYGTQQQTTHNPYWSYFGKFRRPTEVTNDLRYNNYVDEEYETTEEDVEETTHLNWPEYKLNLTEGYIENSIFSVPKITG